MAIKIEVVDDAGTSLTASSENSAGQVAGGWEGLRQALRQVPVQSVE